MPVLVRGDTCDGEGRCRWVQTMQKVLRGTTTRPGTQKEKGQKEQKTAVRAEREQAKEGAIRQGVRNGLLPSRGGSRKVDTENNTNITNRMGINRGKAQGMQVSPGAGKAWTSVDSPPRM